MGFVFRHNLSLTFVIGDSVLSWFSTLSFFFFFEISKQITSAAFCTRTFECIKHFHRLVCFYLSFKIKGIYRTRRKVTWYRFAGENNKLVGSVKQVFFYSGIRLSGTVWKSCLFSRQTNGPDFPFDQQELRFHSTPYYSYSNRNSSYHDGWFVTCYLKFSFAI